MAIYKDKIQVPLGLIPDRTLFVIPGDIISDSICSSGIWEIDLSKKLLELAQNGGIMVEVGANIGYFTVLWASHQNCNVLAFEPSFRNIELLYSNIIHNELMKSVDIIPVAIGREIGLSRFDLGPIDQTGWGGIVKDNRLDTVLVPVVTLDQLLPKDMFIDVLKIDVEGADTWVLLGAQRIIQDHRVKRIYFEQNIGRMKQLGIRNGEAQEFLKTLGYSVKSLTTEDSDVVEWEAWF